MHRPNTGLTCDVCGRTSERHAPGARDSRRLADLDGWSYQRMSSGLMMDVCASHPHMGIHEREQHVLRRRGLA